MPESNTSLKAQFRETRLPFVLVGFCFLSSFLIQLWGPALADIVFAAPQPGVWYEWQLAEPTWLTRLSAWGGYVLHQLFFWWVIYKAQSQKLNYSKTLHPINYIALGGTAFFIFLHIGQTHAFYDGLAQEVSGISAQFSVILMLSIMMIIENRRRGLVLGKPAPFSKRATDFTRKYHGYYIAWAITYTFWFHPAEGNLGHVTGFFYIFLIMMQGSIFFTRLHTNRVWTFFQESVVVIHAIALSFIIDSTRGMAIFFFGFGAVFLLTTLHGVGLSKRGLYTALGLFVAVLAWYLFATQDYKLTRNIAFTPVALYFFAFLIVGLVHIALMFSTKNKPAIVKTS